jgi:MFS family permease
MILFKDSIPESPKWLLSRDSTEASRQKVVTLFNKIRPSDYNVESEIQVILDETKNDANNDATWGEVFACRKAVIIGVGLMFFQAATGINSVVFYSSSIFQLAGFSESIIGTAIWTIVNFFMTFVSAKLIDQTGRKILILSGTYGMLFSLLLLSLVLLSPIDGTIQGIIAVLAILLFVAGFAIGLGAVCWTILSEIMPTRLRSKAISLFLSVNWGTNLLIAMLTLTAINGLGGVKSDMDDDEQKDAQKVGVGALYLVFAGVTAASLAFIHLYVPETKGTSIFFLKFFLFVVKHHFVL